MKIDELIMFPNVRNTPDSPEFTLAVPGRHQIKDGMTRKLLHPAEVLWKR